MVIPKCPNTITGKHFFENNHDYGCGNMYCIDCRDKGITKPEIGEIKCKFCGIVDDRETNK